MSGEFKCKYCPFVADTKEELGIHMRNCQARRIAKGLPLPPVKAPVTLGSTDLSNYIKEKHEKFINDQAPIGNPIVKLENEPELREALKPKSKRASKIGVISNPKVRSKKLCLKCGHYVLAKLFKDHVADCDPPDQELQAPQETIHEDLIKNEPIKPETKENPANEKIDQSINQALERLPVDVGLIETEPGICRLRSLWNFIDALIIYFSKNREISRDNIMELGNKSGLKESNLGVLIACFANQGIIGRIKRYGSQGNKVAFELR